MAKSVGSDTFLLSRAFDDGTTLLVRGAPGADGVAEGFAISEAYCTRAECTCRTVSVRLRRLQSSDGGVSVIEGRKLDTEIDLDTGKISLDPAVPPDAQDVELLEPMRGLFDSALLDVLRGRWQRVKDQQRPDEWRSVDWNKIDLSALVPYCEVFPSQWDICLVSGNRRYWALDSWCMNPDCSCEHATVEFLAESGPSAGTVRVHVGKLEVVETLGSPSARGLWDELIVDQGVQRRFRERRREMRKVARALPRFLQSSTTSPARVERVGRNEPCPCGSGKKHKRCCGR